MGLAKALKNQAADKRAKARMSKYEAVADVDVDGLEGILTELDKDLLCDALLAIWRSGDALMLGSTRDGGAATISVYEGGEKVVSKVLGNARDVEALLNKLLEAARAL